MNIQRGIVQVGKHSHGSKLIYFLFHGPFSNAPLVFITPLQDFDYQTDYQDPKAYPRDTFAVTVNRVGIYDCHFTITRADLVNSVGERNDFTPGWGQDLRMQWLALDNTAVPWSG